MKRLLIILFLILISPCLAGAATYYVDCNANGDAGAGTGTGAAVAWKTINKVNTSSFSAGDSILFNKGCTWREKLTVPSASITIGSYGTGSDPIIRGTTAVSSWTDNNGSTANTWYATLAGATAADMVWEGTTFLADKKSAEAQLVNAGDWWHSTGNNRLYVFKTSEPSGVEASQRNCMEIYGKDSVTVTGLTLERCQNTGIDLYGSLTASLSSLTIRNVSYHGVQFNASSTGTVTGCTISNPGLRMGDGAGVEIMDGSTATVQNSSIFCDATFSGGNQDGVMVEKGGGAASSATIQSNLIYSMDNSGVSIYNNSGGTVSIRYNKIYNNVYHGIQYNSTGDSSLFSAYYNIISGNGPTQAGRGFISMGNSDGGAVNNNTFYDNNTGVFVEDDCSLTSLRNNIIATNRGYGIDGETGAAITSMDYNLLNGNATAAYHGAFSAAANDLTSAPPFVSVTDFRLTLALAGTSVGLTRDYGGYSVSGVPSIGAWQYGAPVRQALGGTSGGVNQ